jgi:cobalt-zinc-cadmium efflux system outer membrane protein
VAVLAALSVATDRATAEGSQDLTLRQAVGRTLERSPALAVSRAQADAAAARIGQADFGPQPEVGLELENFAGTGDVNGIDALETTLQLSRAVESGGKRRRRIDTARAGHDIALAELDAARLDVAAETARRFMALLGAQEQLRTAQRFLELAKAISAQAQRRVAAGNALSAELHRARAQVGREQLLVLRAEAEIGAAWRTLAASWGAPDSLPMNAAGDLFAVQTLQPLPDLLARVERSPRFAALAAGERLREAERRLAESQARADISLSLGVRYLSEPDDAALVAGIAVPFGSRARSRALVVESAALVEQARAEREANLTDAMATVGGLHRQIEVRLESLAVLERDVLPAATEALAQIERGYRLGRLSYAEYAVAARESLDGELERVGTAIEYHQLLTEIERLTGVAVPAGGDVP